MVINKGLFLKLSFSKRIISFFGFFSSFFFFTFITKLSFLKICGNPSLVVTRLDAVKNNLFCKGTAHLFG